ncbi:MAG: pentapeptide repeat-containing protein [Cyanobacteria bacterium J06614_10]
MSADFSGEILRGRSYRGQNLSGANFSGAWIQSTDFSEANLTGADFTGAIAGVRRRSMVLVCLLLLISGCTLGLLGSVFADTLNTSYLFYFGPRDAISAFSTLLLFSLLLVTRGLIAAVITTVTASLVVWVALFLVAYARTRDFLDSLLGGEADTTQVITIMIIVWAGLSLIPSLCGMLMATAHFQTNCRRSFGRFEMLTLACALAVSVPGAMSFFGTLAKVNAPIDAVIVWLLSLHTQRRVMAGHAGYVWLRSGALALAAWGGTSFRSADLSDANFSGTRLNAADLTGAKLMRTCLQQARSVDYARVGRTLLRQPEVRQLLVTGYGAQQNYAECDLRGAYLVESVLTGADFTQADLAQADLTGSQLRGAMLKQVQAVGTCLRGATLTGSCLESWNIDTTTQLDNIACDYIYLLRGERERRPSVGVFQPGDFTKLFQDVLHTVDLIFREGLDMSAFMAAFQQVQAGGESVSVRSIENKGDGVVVVKVEVPDSADKPKIQSLLTQEYEQALQRLEARYQAELSAKDAQIELYRQHRSELSQLTDLLSQQLGSQAASPTVAGKRVVLKVGRAENGGRPVTLQIGEEGAGTYLETSGRLSSPSSLIGLQQRWQQAYRQVADCMAQNTRISAPLVQVTNVSYQEMFQTCQDLETELMQQMNSWLNSAQFRPVREALMASLKPEDSIRLVLQTADQKIRRLPFHLWTWFDRYSRAELVLSEESYHQLPSTKDDKFRDDLGGVRVLAILGDGEGLDIERDRTLLSQLPDVALTCLVEPGRSQLNDSLWSQPWDILFFAGHTTCQDAKQQLRINPDENLTLSELKYALRKATERGLKLAIFNACDGLQLMQDLHDISLPPTIVMRYPIPDKVAQAFLKYFLTAFSKGMPLHQAVREAREQLQGLESQFPFATWLPVLCQNPASLPLRWQDLRSQ